MPGRLVQAIATPASILATSEGLEMAAPKTAERLAAPEVQFTVELSCQTVAITTSALDFGKFHVSLSGLSWQNLHLAHFLSEIRLGTSGWAPSNL